MKVIIIIIGLLSMFGGYYGIKNKKFFAERSDFITGMPVVIRGKLAVFLGWFFLITGIVILFVSFLSL